MPIPLEHSADGGKTLTRAHHSPSRPRPTKHGWRTFDAESRIADVVLVDTAGFGNRAAAVVMTDAVLIPTLCGEADITEAEKTVRLVEGLARAARRDIPARVLLNRVKRNSLAMRPVRSKRRSFHCSRPR